MPREFKCVLVCSQSRYKSAQSLRKVRTPVLTNHARCAWCVCYALQLSFALPVFAKGGRQKRFALTFLSLDHLYLEQNDLRNLLHASELQNSANSAVKQRSKTFWGNPPGENGVRKLEFRVRLAVSPPLFSNTGIFKLFPC